MDFNALEAKFRPIDVSPRQTQKTRGRGGFLSSLISEGGALGGGAAGAAAGSILGPVGTLVGGGLGAAVGAFGGRLAENKIRDDRYGVGDAAKEAAISGVLSASPIKLFKGGKAALGALEAGGGKLAAKEAAETAVTKPGVLGTLLSKFTGKAGAKAGKIADDAALKNFKINDSNWLTGFQKNIGEDAGAFARRLNFASESPKGIVDKVYKPLAEVYGAHLDKLPAVGKSFIAEQFDAAIKPLASNPARRELADKLSAKAQTLLADLPEEISAKEVNTLKSQFQSVVDRGLTDKAGKLDNNINQKVADVFRKVVNQVSDESGIVINPADLPVKGVKATTLSELGKELQGISEFADKAATKVNVGRGKNPVGLTRLIGGGVGSAAIGGPAGLVAGVGVPTIANSAAGRKAELQGASLISKFLTKGGQETADTAAARAIEAAASGAKRTAGATLLSKFTGAGQSPSDPNMSGSIQNTNMNNNPQPMNDNISQLDSPGGEMSSSPDMQSGIDTAIQQALAAGDYKGLTALLSVAKYYQDREGSGAKGLNSAASGVVADTKTGLSSLAALSDKIAGSNANNPVIGSIRAANPFDTNAKSLQADIATAKQIVGKALEGGVLRKEDEAKYAKILPTVSDTDAVAQYKIKELIQLISTRLGEYQGALSGGSGGVDPASLGI